MLRVVRQEATFANGHRACLSSIALLLLHMTTFSVDVQKFKIIVSKDDLGSVSILVLMMGRSSTSVFCLYF